ncbi:hypothetical protein AVEN_179895-1 [Araneus ventricosus]|uniref:Uncharacterized protein n=1 Tax=Araneus ventricosus TaxID=182803 RepID=A0A4Y2M5C1_ARAVE|nr:hypothetical protein AVEN_179895-1 [Araneus ventricosus]
MKTFTTVITDMSAVIREVSKFWFNGARARLGHAAPRSYQGRNSSESSESASLRTNCSRNPEIKPTYPQSDPCSFRPCHFLGSLLTLDRTHPKPDFL